MRNSSGFMRMIRRSLLGAGVLCTALAIGTNAQVETSTSVSSGPATKVVKVERGTVVHVAGNNVVIKAEDGTLRDFNNVPDSVTVTVDGKQLNVHQLQPGMTVERTTITTTTPKVITTTKTVSGTVFNVIPPVSVILTMEDGKNQQFNIPKGQKFMIQGKETDAFGLRKGMQISATAVTEVPQTVIAQQIKRTGQAPPPPPPPDPNVAVLIIAVPVPPTPPPAAAAEPTVAQLPKTASSLPLLGLLGVFLCSLGLGLMAKRAFGA
jgi:hypothetical protein